MTQAGPLERRSSGGRGSIEHSRVAVMVLGKDVDIVKTLPANLAGSRLTCAISFPIPNRSHAQSCTATRSLLLITPRQLGSR